MQVIFDPAKNRRNAIEHAGVTFEEAKDGLLMHSRGNAMKTNLYKKFKDYDFADAKPAKDVPALRKLHAEQSKERITIRLDATVLSAFRAEAAAAGSSYQALINEVLRQHLLGKNLVKTVRDTIRRELRAA